MAELVLGSASPRRSALLSQHGIAFSVVAAHVDESFEPQEQPGPIAADLAERKACAVSGLVAPDAKWVLAADTLVVVEHATGGLPHYLGKPSNREQARLMLARLSGTTHRVVTGVAALRLAGGELISVSETTFVTMRAITSLELDQYVDSGEWQDKAGGYAIQENADRFVTKLEGGGFDNVVGLPVELALDLLGTLGWTRPVG